MTYRHPLPLSADENPAIRKMIERTTAAGTTEGRDLLRRLEDHYGPAFRGAEQQRHEEHGKGQRGADRR